MMRQITNQMIYNVLVSKSEYLHCVGFQKESLRTFLDFESKFLQLVRLSTKNIQCGRFRIKGFQRVGIGIKDFTKCQISNQNFRKVTDFETKKLQHIRFRIKSVTTCRFSIQNNYKVSNFKKKVSQRFYILNQNFAKWPNLNQKITTCENSNQFFENVSDLETKNQLFRNINRSFNNVSDLIGEVYINFSFSIKKFRSVRVRFEIFTRCEVPNQKLFRVKIWTKKFTTCQAFRAIIDNALDLEWKPLQCVKFWKQKIRGAKLQTKKFTTCGYLKQKVYVVSDFGKKVLRRV